MKQVILKLVLTLGSLFIILLVLNKTNDTFFYTNYTLASKYKYLENAGDDFNTLVIGSSHINRQFIPKSFDKETGLKSFNLGIGGMMTLESMYNLENILDRDLYANVELILLLTDGYIIDIPDNRVKMVKARHYLDWTRFKLGLKYHINKKSYAQARRYTYLYIYNLFSVGQIKKLFFGNSANSSKDYPWIENEAGFFTYGKVNHYGYRFYRQKNTYFEKGHDFKIKDLSPTIKLTDKIIIDELERLSKKAARKNITLTLITPPNSNLHLKAPHLNCLYLGDGVDFPAYFDARNKANRSHLNEEGAKIYTKRIADLFNQMK